MEREKIINKELQNQIASLEEALQEEKQSNTLLKDQKKGFKDMVEKLKSRLIEVDSDLEAATLSELTGQKKIEELAHLLKMEVVRNEENGHAVECLEVLTVALFMFYSVQAMFVTVDRSFLRDHILSYFVLLSYSFHVLFYFFHILFIFFSYSFLCSFLFFPYSFHILIMPSSPLLFSSIARASCRPLTWKLRLYTLK